MGRPRSPRPDFEVERMSKKILLAHGSGGRIAHDLIERLFLKSFNNPLLAGLEDSATVDFSGRLAFTTDSYVVSPIFFPGGDIGKLAVCGTVNDLAMAGARPLYLSLALIIEEGLPIEDLERIVESIARTAAEAGVQIVTGDTKVVHHGAADKIFINTSGVGMVPGGLELSSASARPGDKVVINGFIGDHGIAVMSKREGLAFGTAIETDCAPLGELVAQMLAASSAIRCFRDPTRGGVATTLNELAAASSVGIRLDDAMIPVREAVAGACEMLGYDPLYVANEGRVIAIVPAEDTDRVTAAMRRHPYGTDAVVIGEVTAQSPGRVVSSTVMGATRIVDMLSGDLLPRIC